MSGTISENWVPFLLLLLIAVTLIWWLGGRYARDAETPDNKDDSAAKKNIVDDKGVPSTPLSTVDTPVTGTTAKPAVKKAAPSKKPATRAAPKKADKKPAAKKAAPKAKATSPKTAPTKPATPKKAKAAIPDNLELLKGVGPKLNTLLASLGVTSFSQIAAWGASDIAEIDARLGNFAGRITRDNWVDQAKLLSNGDIETFEKKYGSLGSEVKG